MLKLFKTKTSLNTLAGTTVTGPQAFMSARGFSKRRATIAAIGTIILGFIVALSFAGDDLSTSQKANTIVVQFNLPHAMMPVSSGNIPMTPTPPFTLYGNGLLICGQDSTMPFMSMTKAGDYTRTALPTSTMLSQAQISTLIQKISNTGFLSLNKEYYASPLSGQQDILRVNLISGDHYVLYYNNVPAPAAYTQTLNLLKSTCNGVNTPYSPSKAILSTLTNANGPGSAKSLASVPASVSPNVTSGFSGADKAAVKAKAKADPQPAFTTKNYSGSAAAALIKAFSTAPDQYIKNGTTTYEESLVLPLPQAKNPLTIDYNQIRQGGGTSLGHKLGSAIPQAQAASQTPVRTVIMVPSDDPISGPLSEAQALTTAVHDWYCGQVGSCYNYTNSAPGDVEVLRGSQTQAWYMTCHTNPCDADPLGTIMDNVQAADAGNIYLTNVDTLMIPSWSTGEFNTGYCGMAQNGGTLGAIDLYEPSPWNPQINGIERSFCQPGQDMGHELGHTFGLNHTTNGTLMDGPTADVPGQTAAGCDIGDTRVPSIPTCRLDPGQAAALRATSYFAGGSGGGGTPPAPVPPINPTLSANQKLYPGQQLTSAGSKYRLILQTDGNLVVYNASGQATWSTGTRGSASADLAMQGDGNLVLYDVHGNALWSPTIQGMGGTTVTMQDDGNLVVANSDGTPVWSLSTGQIGFSDRISNGQKLYPGQQLLSAQHHYRLYMQTDGNLVVYNQNNQPTWQTGTNGTSPGYLYMQGDSNLALYNSAIAPLWTPNIRGLGGAYVAMQDDGNLVVDNSAGYPIWSIFTGTYPTPSTLGMNSGLTPGHQLFSASHLYRLYMQADGNLVVYNANNTAIWQTATNGRSAGHLEMQSDSNLVLYDASNNPVWTPSIRGMGGTYLVMQDDGNLVVYTSSNQPVWSTVTNRYNFPDRLYNNQYLYPGQELISAAHQYRILLQTDGNLVVYNANNGAIWASGTNGQTPGYLVMQGDGNLVLRGPSGNTIWTPNTQNRGAYFAAIQDDGNLVVETSTNTPLWSIFTGKY